MLTTALHHLAGLKALYIVPVVVVTLRLLLAIPVWPIFGCIRYLPSVHKWPAVKCMLSAWLKSMLVVPIDLTAPVVIPVALLFTRWESDSLPRLFSPWDIDKPCTINGDARTDDASDGLGGWALKPVPVEDTPEARAMCYWAKGHHPRSFWARFVWLGLRNRGSRTSQALGYYCQNLEQKLEASDGLTISWHQEVYRYKHEVTLGKLVLRSHCGYKIPTTPGCPKSPVVSIGLSLKVKR